MGEAVLSSEFSQHLLLCQMMSELCFLPISASCSSEEAWRRENKSDHSPMLFLLLLFHFLKQDTLGAGMHTTCRQAGKNNFCLHDSSVSPAFISPPFICEVFVPCCSAALQHLVSEWQRTGEREQMRQRTQRSARERTELRKRRQIHTLAELSLTYILLQIRPFLCF